jgi:predicted flap endonuclease-1-like 5' DNA nuclease
MVAPPATPLAPPVNVPVPSDVPVPTASSLPTPVNVRVEPRASAASSANHATGATGATGMSSTAAASGTGVGASSASSASASSASGPVSQPPATLVHPLGGSHPPSPVSQPPRPSYAPQTVPSGAAAANTDARVRELQAQVVRARQELASAQVELRTARGEADNLRAELSVAKSRVEALEVELNRSRSAAITQPGDDLKVIKGIGPKYEKLLRSAGVTSLAEIASWNEADVDAIAKKLGIKADRIRKDDWVGNAKRLGGG